MQHITSQKYVDKETYGSRMGKSAPEALITLQTLFSHCATWNITVSMMFNDAAGCFDRIPLVLAEIAAVGSGCDRSIMRCHTETQKRMKHYVRTAAGVSEGFIQFNSITMITLLTFGLTVFHGLIGGIGQGGGGGPILWLMVSVIMIEALRKLCTGATMEHVLGWYTYTLWLVSYVDDNTLLKTFSLGATPELVFSDMRKMMKHWHRLLQITGGDLCLDKCKVSVLTWNTNNYWGIPTPSTISQFPGEVTMISDLDPYKEKVVLERIEPNVGERILGVRLPILGAMTEELKYRIQQMNSMANDLHKAPFDPFDAWMVYESRYRAAIRYPLPVTMFSELECDAIQKPFIFHLLPKLGLNRHTPRAIIYGPKRWAGLELMDLRVEQPAMQFNSSLGHLRRQDQAGKGLLMNMADLQAEIGSVKPVFTLNYNIYNYGQQHTRIHYLWRTTYDHSCLMRGWDEWVPTSLGQGDSNLMDTAVEDEYFSNNNNYKLTIINNCRLYLGAIFLSDLATDGRIRPEILDGNELAINPQVKRIDRLRPPSRAWGVWKDFIFRNFLVYPYTLVQPIRGTTEKLPIHRKITEVEHLEQLYMNQNTTNLDLIISRLPPDLRLLLGTYNCPQDQGRSLAAAIAAGTALGASDGSVIHTYNDLYGGYASTIQMEMSNEHAFSQYAPSPHSTGLSSTTTEIYGFIAATILIHVICIAHNVTTGSVTIYIDNQEAGKKGRDEPVLININDYLAPDYDITMLLRQLIQLARPQIHYEWVKSLESN